MINPIKTVVKCCGCIVLSQLIGIVISIGALAAFVLVFYLYAIPWGEDQIRDALHVGRDVDIGALNASIVAANNCSGCVFGVNTDWPTNTTGTLHFLDTSAGPTASAVIATSLVAAAGAGAASMLWASLVPSAAAALSFSSGFYEMTHIVEQAQFIGMISQLQIDGAPVFLHQFSRELAWTNFNVPKAITDAVANTSTARRRLVDSSSLLSTTASGETGPKRYAALIGVAPTHLFFYTLLSFVLVIAAIHGLYILGVVVLSLFSKKKSVSDVASTLYRKVVWAMLLALLLAQYIFSMAGSYYIYANTGAGTKERDAYFVVGALALGVTVAFAILFGVLVIGTHRDELRDLGTLEHDNRPFAAKYGAYYDEYNFDNRFFFVPRILLAVSTGAVVGVVQDATAQLLCILGLTLAYLVLLLVREPHLLRFLYYIGLASVFLKVVLVCMMLLLVQDDVFPQSVRDNVAYGIVGVNMFIFFLLFLRQAYTIGHKVVRGCKNKDKAMQAAVSSDDDDRRDVINLERGNRTTDREAAQRPVYARMESTSNKHSDERGLSSPYQQQQGYGNQSVVPPYQQQSQQSQQAQQAQQSYGNASAAASQQSAYTQPFARDSVGFGGVQRSPYDRPSSDAAAIAGVAGSTGARGNKHGLRDAPNDWSRHDAHTQQQSQHWNAADSMAAGAMVGAAAAATRDRPYGASPVRGGATTFSKPLRKTSIDLDDMEDSDVVVEPFATTAAIDRPAGREPLRGRQSYVRFSDSDMSSLDDDIDSRELRAPPVSATSVASTFSADSTATDWFDRRSKTEIEDAGDSGRGGPSATSTTVASTFAQRESIDSYSTDVGANHSLLSAGSSSNGNGNGVDKDRSSGTTGFTFDNVGADSIAPSRDVDIDDDDELERSYSVDLYGTDATTAYVLGGSDDGGGDSGSAMLYGTGARNDSDSFVSAVSTQSEDDAQFYIDGQRRYHRESPVVVSEATARESMPQRPKKL